MNTKRISCVDSNCINVFYVNIGSIQDVAFEKMCKVLSVEENNKLRNISNEKVKASFLATRWLVRSMLAKITGVNPNGINFRYGEFGKPYLNSNDKNVFFNISHSGEIVACAVTSNCEIGIDIEKTERHILDVAYSFFCHDEIMYLEELLHNSQNDEAIKIWTKKEAYVKANGYGLSMSFDSFSVINSCDKFFKTFIPKKGYYLSVAVPKEKEGTVSFNFREVRCDINE